jgi:hypothetical protein
VNPHTQRQPDMHRPSHHASRQRAALVRFMLAEGEPQFCIFLSTGMQKPVSVQS